MSNRASNGKFVSPSKLSQAISSEKKTSEAKSCFASGAKPLQTQTIDEHGRQFMSALRLLKLQLTLIMWADRALHLIFLICCSAASITFAYTFFRDPSVGPLITLFFKCWLKKGECQQRAVLSLFPTERIVEAYRLSIKLTETGLADAEVLQELGIPLILNSFPIMAVAVLLFFALARLSCFAHNQAVHLATIIATVCPS